jgi:hypothetical protein
VIPRRGVIAATRIAAVCCLAAGCIVDEDAFHERVFVCDTAARDPHCGDDRSGRPMTCFPASQLDGTDFCTEACSAPMSLPDEGAVCVQGEAKLQACNPVDTTNPAGPCGRDDLGCLRTDVTSDEGVCVTMEPCTKDRDCPNPVRSTCAATFLNQLYAKQTDMHSDHLYCLQRGCVAGGAACAPGQSCLPKVVDLAALPPDICVPNCDAQDRCPPNHFCFSKLSGPGSPRICLPGLLGFLCESDIDCMVGKCMSDNEPDEALRLNLCTVTCATDAECAAWDSDQGKFVCIDGRCTTPDAYRGARCYSDADCTRDETPTLPTHQGTCSRLCDAGGACGPRGGFGHVCLSFTVDKTGASKPGCYPGYFGIPCTADDNCVGGMLCRSPGGAAPTVCTTLCQTNEDCRDNHFVPGDAVCVGSVCVKP